MNAFVKIYLLLGWMLICVQPALAQKKTDTLILDSVKLAPKYKFLNKVIRGAIVSIKRTPADTTQQKAMNAKADKAYKRYEGRYVRNIVVKQLRFDQFVTDDEERIIVFGTKLLNSLHADTRDWVIRDNVFLRNGDEINAYKVADNERYLRTLPFIQDARIVIKPVPGKPDSADLIVITRDLFSITGGVDFGNPKNIKADISDVNFLGMGQRLQYDFIVDQARSPVFGFNTFYRKNNIGGSFVDATVGYSQIGPNIADEEKEERSTYFQLDKALVSPYMRTAGGLYLAHRESFQKYPRDADSQFYKYSNNSVDAWAGYNIADRKLLNSNKIRDRRFIALRYAQTNFDKQPEQVKNKIDADFSDMQAVLGAITFFRQDFYKTNYIYGFGTTEDVPYGYNISVISGWQRLAQLKRPYTGITASKYWVSPSGRFLRATLRTGSFYNNGKLQDAGVLLATTVFLRLYEWRKLLVRPYFAASYARLFDHITGDDLYINNPFGLRHASSTGVAGYQRINLNTETSVFLNYKLLGFRFATVVGANATLLTPNNLGINKSDVYAAVEAGLRARNENLVFGTLELRAAYFPRPIPNMPAFRIIYTPNLRFRYNTNYVVKPDFVNYNADDNY